MGNIGIQNLVTALSRVGASAVAQVGPDATTELVPILGLQLTTADFAGGWAVFDAGAFGSDAPPTVAPIASNTTDTLAFAASVLPSAPAEGANVWLYQVGTFNVTVTAPENVAEWGGQPVAAADAGGRPTVVSTSAPQTAGYVSPGTAIAATTPILLTYGSGLSHYAVPANGTLNVCVALSAAATLTVSHDAGVGTPSYNAMNGGTALAAATEYAFSVPVRSGEVVDYEVSAAATADLFDVYFVASQ